MPAGVLGLWWRMGGQLGGGVCWHIHQFQDEGAVYMESCLVANWLLNFVAVAFWESLQYLLNKIFRTTL